MSVVLLICVRARSSRPLRSHAQPSFDLCITNLQLPPVGDAYGPSSYTMVATTITKSTVCNCLRKPFVHFVDRFFLLSLIHRLLTNLISMFCIKVFRGHRRFDADFLAALLFQGILSHLQQSRTNAFPQMIFVYVHSRYLTLKAMLAKPDDSIVRQRHPSFARIGARPKTLRARRGGPILNDLCRVISCVHRTNRLSSQPRHRSVVVITRQAYLQVSMTSSVERSLARRG